MENIVAKFPHKILPSINDEPDYETIHQMFQCLYGNAASLPTRRAGGQHGHIGLIMNANLYATLSAEAYTIPPVPGATPAFPANTSAATIDNRLRAYAITCADHNNHQNMDAALKTQIIETVDDDYLCEVKHRYTGYMGVSTRDLMDHLIDRYGKITPADIALNKVKMEEPLDPSQSIALFFRRIDDCVQYAADGLVPYTPEQILQTTYNQINASGYYTEACKTWRNKAAADKNWINFKTFFADQYHDAKDQLKHTGGNNFQSANAIQEEAITDISTALDNLAMAASNDRDIVAELTKNNSTLVNTNKSLTEQLKTANETIKSLSKSITPKKRGSSKPHNNYCWSHGYVYGAHNSETCNRKLEGHKDTATKDNRQGGSTAKQPDTWN